ncbi:MAG TPA: hypothetical protein VFZ65_00360 [Planctomycetota bacterium]|nr:hypothetical protein [Planctomycetota bacterium]
MARSQRKNGGPTRGRFKLKKLGKGYSTTRKEPVGSRPVLRVTNPEALSSAAAAKAKSTQAKATSKTKAKSGKA